MRPVAPRFSEDVRDSFGALRWSIGTRGSSVVLSNPESPYSGASSSCDLELSPELFAAGQTGCLARPPVPSLGRCGLFVAQVHDELSQRRALGDVLRTPGSRIWRAVEEDEERECVEWTVHPDHTPEPGLEATGTLIHRWPEPSSDGWDGSGRRYGLAGSVVRLSAPRRWSEEPRPAEALVTCHPGAMMVTFETRDFVRFATGEDWFHSLETCEAAAEPSGPPEAIALVPGGVGGCG
jgi:hypothetical protein